MANDPAVKAGSWGPKTVEKILHPGARLRNQVPMIYLVDSAGARITDQVRMFPAAGEPGASSNQVRLQARFRRSACCSAPCAAAPTSRPSATS